MAKLRLPGCHSGSGHSLDGGSQMKKQPEKKPSPKKLSLKKETVRVLNDEALAQVVGGKTTAISCTCPTTVTA